MPSPKFLRTLSLIGLMTCLGAAGRFGEYRRPRPLDMDEKALLRGGGCYKLVYDTPCPAPWSFGNDCTQWGCYYNASNTITCGVPSGGTGSKYLLSQSANLPSCHDVNYGESGYDTCGQKIYICATGINCPNSCFKDTQNNYWCMRSNGNVNIASNGDSLGGNQCRVL